MPKPKFGVILPTFVTKFHSPNFASLSEMAKITEDLGFESLWVYDHLLKPEPGYKCTWLEPLVVLAALSPVTKRIRLGTSVLVLPLRNPVLLAKELSTLDNMCDGRVILGVAAGWHRGEFDACAVLLKDRGKRMEEQIKILRRLWTEDHVSSDGEYYKLNDVTIEPKPVQKPCLPIWMGGGRYADEKRANQLYNSWSLEKVYRRIAIYADGWITRSWAIGEDTKLVEQEWHRISTYARELGRDPTRIVRAHNDLFYITKTGDLKEVEAAASQITNYSVQELAKFSLIGTPDCVAQRIRQRVRAGIEHLMFKPLSGDIQQLELLVDEVLPQVS